MWLSTIARKGKANMAGTTANRNPFRIPKLQINEAGQWTSDDPTKGGIDPKKGGLLGFALANAKLKALREAAAKRLGIPVAKVKVFTLTLPAGWSCPGASECLAFADPLTGRIWDSPTLEFRCFAASAEARPSVRNLIWHNFNLLRSRRNSNEIAGLIIASLEEATRKLKDDDVVIVRIQVGGDFYSRAYLEGWAIALRAKPKITGYAYSKSMHHVEKLGLDSLPENFVLTASRGGKFDDLIDRLGLKESVVVYSLEEAEAKGLEIDHDDSHAVWSKESFGLLIHGTQPKGSEAAKAKVALQAKGVKAGYSNG